MGKFVILLSFITFLINGSYGQSAKCFILEYREYCDEIFTEISEKKYTFGTKEKCMDFYNRNIVDLPGSWQAEHCNVSVLKPCSECEKTDSERKTPLNMEMSAAPSIEEFGKCKSRVKNSAYLKERVSQENQSEPHRLFFEAASSLALNLDCGLYIKNIDCQGKTCSVEWEVDEGDNFTDISIYRASIDKFYEDLKEDIKRQKEQQQERALLKLTIESMNDYFFDEQGDIGTLFDSDDDGRIDLISSNRHKELLIDSDGNGTFDTKVIIDAEGRKEYIFLDERDESSLLKSLTAETRQINAEDVSESINSLVTAFEKNLQKQEETSKVPSLVKSFSDYPSDSPAISAGLKDLGQVANQMGYFDNVTKVQEFMDDTNNKGKRFDAVQGIYGQFSKLYGFSGRMYRQNATGIPDLISGSLTASMESAASFMETGEYDPTTVYEPFGNYFGDVVGVGAIGTKARNYNSEGHLSFLDLKNKYGWYEAAKRAAWYYLLEDLKGRDE